MLEIRTLGEASLLHDGVRVNTRTKKAFALIVYLTFACDKYVQRDKLASLLWESHSLSKARHSLSQALYAIRNAIPDLQLDLTTETVRLSSDGVTSDVHIFKSALSDGNAKGAVDVYGGPFLDGFWIRGAHAFEEWQEHMREEIDGLAQTAFRKILLEAESGGDWLAVERVVNRLLEFDPYHEQLHQTRIEAIAALGDRPRAINLWRNVQLRFANDLHRPFDSSVASYIENVLNAREEVHLDYSPPNAIRPRFVGRGTYFTRLRSIWERTKVGHGSLAVVAGEAGIGKTRLCDHFVRLTAIQGARVLSGRCYSTERQVPYSAIADAVANSVELDDVRTLSGPWCSGLANLVPELFAGFRDQEVHGAYTTSRRAILECILQLFRHLCSRGPVVLYLDDVHWADDSTAAALHYLARRANELPLLVLIAYRVEEISVSAPISSICRNPKGVISMERIHLPELSREEVHDLVAEYAAKQGIAINPKRADQLYQLVGGRPFFLIEYLSAMARGRDEWNADAENLSFDIPSSIERFFSLKFDELSFDAGQLMASLAVLGRGASPAVLCQVGGVKPLDALRPLLELVSKRIAVERGDTVMFAHDLLREAAYRWISGSRRKVLHASAAATLEQYADTTPGTLAMHYDLAGNREMAFISALRAADSSAKVHSHVEAEYYLRLALANASNQGELWAAQDKLAFLLYQCRRHVEAGRYFELLREYYAAMSNSRGILIAEVNGIATSLRLGRLSADDSVNALDRCVQHAEEIGDASLTSEVLRKLGSVAHYAGRKEVMLHIAKRLLTKLPSLTQPREIVPSLCVAANILGLYESTANGLRYSQQALDVAQDAGDDQVLLVALRSRAKNGLQAGRLKQAEADIQDAMVLAERVGNDAVLVDLLITTAVMAIETGQFSEATGILERLARVIDAIDAIHEDSLASANWMILNFETHNSVRAIKYANDLLAVTENVSTWWCTITAWSILGLYAIERGDFTEANRCRREIMLRLEGRELWVADASYVEMFLARLAAADGQPELALERLERAIAAYEGRDVFCRSRLQLERARVLREIDTEESRRQAEEVRRCGREIGARPLVVKAELILD